MTREEAREILTHNWTRVDNPNYSESDLDEAFFMAIEALSAEAVHKPDYSYEADMVKRLRQAIGNFPNDLISRSALMEYCSNQKSKSIDNNDIARFPSAELANLKQEFGSAEAEPTMTEEVREALMRLTMCAREECGMCKYKDECGFDFQYKISTDNMNTLADALLRSKCEVDAKSADAVQGEWIKTVGGNGWNEWWVFKCPFCGATIEDKQYHSWDYNFCPSCGTRLKGAEHEID